MNSRRTTTKGQVNRSGQTVASEAPPREAGAGNNGSVSTVTAKRTHEPKAGAGTGDRADDLPAPMPESRHVLAGADGRITFGSIKAFMDRMKKR